MRAESSESLETLAFVTGAQGRRCRKWLRGRRTSRRARGGGPIPEKPIRESSAAAPAGSVLMAALLAYRQARSVLHPQT